MCRIDSMQQIDLVLFRIPIPHPPFDVHLVAWRSILGKACISCTFVSAMVTPRLHAITRARYKSCCHLSMPFFVTRSWTLRFWTWISSGFKVHSVGRLSNGTGKCTGCRSKLAICKAPNNNETGVCFTDQMWTNR